MYDRLPGTNIESRIGDKGVSDSVLGNIFACGGLVLSQVSGLTGLEPYVIQNWVKRGFLPPPVKKMYSRRQFCRIVIINMLKDSMKLERITKLLSYINGVLSDESDDLIDDSKLYDYFVDTLFLLHGELSEEAKADEAIAEAITDYNGPVPGSAKRLAKVLKVMLFAYYSSEVMKKAEMLMNELN